MKTCSGKASNGFGWRRCAVLAIGILSTNTATAEDATVLPLDHSHQFVERLNAADDEYVVNLIPNADAAAWIADKAPRFDCPSTRFVETFYFRWWTLRKHIKQTPDGRVLTEFITPVSHAGAHNTISCALGHHIAEARWLRDQSLLDEYLHFWLRGGPIAGPQPHLHKFSSWLAAAINQRRLATGDDAFATDLLDDLVADYERWEDERQLPSGLFWQHDVKDGMEESISGGRRVQNIRPTINSYMVGNAEAIAELARLAGRDDLAHTYQQKTETLKALAVEAMWDSEAKCFKVRLENGELSGAREEIGYIPWLFGLATDEHAVAWKQTQDREGFWAPRGLTTAERRHPEFRSHGVGTCEWDGAVWPFATSQTLGGMANVLRGPEQPYVTRRDYFEHLLRYAESHHKDGAAYIGEYHDEVTGDWLITGPKERRSRYYNHSTFCDLVITGLVGVTPMDGDQIRVSPLLPEDSWDWFCLDGLPYRGRELTVVWDRAGTMYGLKPGLTLLCDGEVLAHADTLTELNAQLPPKAAKDRTP
ncbi:MGH1-like glycoside hydrolase domain-containing protein [Aeoliella sp.]|uniref:MGH1-like glycoside hydrolase domain-containing protein n=1 Tax=Aeoliella sp. TaxID=2795800 RepID=UPI003CCBB337